MTGIISYNGGYIPVHMIESIDLMSRTKGFNYKVTLKTGQRLTCESWHLDDYTRKLIPAVDGNFEVWTAGEADWNADGIYLDILPVVGWESESGDMYPVVPMNACEYRRSSWLLHEKQKGVFHGEGLSGINTPADALNYLYADVESNKKMALKLQGV